MEKIINLNPEQIIDLLVETNKISEDSKIKNCYLTTKGVTIIFDEKKKTDIYNFSPVS